MSKKIYVNGTILHETPTGLGVYAKNILINRVLKSFSRNDR